MGAQLRFMDHYLTSLSGCLLELSKKFFDAIYLGRQGSFQRTSPEGHREIIPKKRAQVKSFSEIFFYSIGISQKIGIIGSEKNS
jgi:hypothetical protein